MKIELKKFGEILTSREAGREALLAYTPTLNALSKNEEIIIDFEGVSVLTPSWADEFLRPILLLKKYTEKISLVNDGNPSVKAALKFANPKLNLHKMTAFKNMVAFDEIEDEKIDHDNKTLLKLTFPYSDEEALMILKNNKVKKISVHPANALDDDRLNSVIQMLNKEGIETFIEKYNRASILK